MSEDSALDRRLPALRKQRGRGIYVAYTIAGALLLGTGALSLGHLAAYRPSAGGRPAMASPVRSDAAQTAPASPVVMAQAQAPTPSVTPAPPPAPNPPPAATGPAPSVTLKMPAPIPADPSPPAPPSPPPPPPAAASPAPASPFAGSPPGFATPPPAPPTIPTADVADAPINLIAANGLPLPPPEKPPMPGRRLGLCAPGTNPADLVENGAVGRLPRIAGNGCMPWLAYAAPFDHLDRERPRLGLAVIGLGVNEALTQKAIETLPPGVTLVFTPETPNLDRWIQRARERGLEAVLLVPAQNPQATQDPGPLALQKGITPTENLRRLRSVLSRASGYVGIALLPSPVLEDAATLRPLLSEIRDRGLLVLEFERWNDKSLLHPMSRELGVPYSTDIDSPIAWIDRFNNGRETTAQDVDTSLAEVEKYVRSARFGLAWSLARPLAIDRIAAWAGGMRMRGLVVAPVTGVTECAEACQKRLPRAPAR